MSDDFYTYAYQQRLNVLQAEYARQAAQLAEAKANGDADTAGQLAEELGNIEARAANLNAVHNRYIASQTPQVPPEPSPEEKQARPWQNMTWNDALDLARTSRYGKNLDWNDPNVRAGYAEVQARRARGE